MPPEKTSRDEEDVLRTVEDWAAAVRAKDYDGILKNHTIDFVLYDVPPPFASKGLDAYKQTWDQFFSWSIPPIRFDIQSINVSAGADVAFVFAKMKCFGPDDQGTPGTLAFRLTIGLRKLGGNWMIAHEHHSVPAE